MRKPVLTILLIGSLLLAACSGKPADGPKTEPAPSSQQNPTPAQPPSAGETAQPPTQPAPTAPEPAKPAEPSKPAEPPKPVKREMPKPVRGILVTGWYAGTPHLVWPLLDWAKEAGINTIVLDIKAEDGFLSWESDIPLAREIGANKRKIADLPKFIAEVKERGFWVSGRIVVMNDQWLYKARPEWGIPGFPGGPYSFMDPKNENVWRYNLDIAKAAIAAGVDEIQWDYIRYPEKLVDGYNKNTTAEYRTSHINSFFKRSMEELKPLGVVVGADLFGLTTSVAEGDDMEIGQDYRQAAEILDYVAAMAYPSHYAPNTYGLPNPNAAPYETIKHSLGKAIERTPGIPLEKHRPWIQDFSMGGVTYGPDEVMAQVRALEELGIHSFMLWDPSCKFTRISYKK
ncbi:MAG: putative glycoside hydrolase [Bacillota bacterium]